MSVYMNSSEKILFTIPYFLAIIAGAVHYLFIRNSYGFWSWPGWSVCFGICTFLLILILYAEGGLVE